MDEQASSAAPRSAGWLFPAAALGLAVAAGLVWMVLRPGSQADTTRVPAPGVTTLVPTPSAFGRTATVTFTVTSVRATLYRTVRLEVHRRNDELTISASSAKEKGRPTALVLGAVSANRPLWYSTDDVLELALVPGFAKDITSVGRASIQTAYLARVDLTAALIERPEETARDFFWADNGGAIHNSRAGIVTSVAIQAGVYSVTVFEDADLGVWGYFDSNVHVVEPITREPIETLRVVSVSESPPGSKKLNWLAMLPPGATHPQLEAGPSTGSGQAAVTWGSARLGSTGRLVVAGSTENGRNGQLGVRKISFTDSSGQHRSFTP
jgi:hypothetical protein